jgi:uncharacterized protein (TIGR02217 family)
MPEIQSFHEVRFPTDIALGAVGGPERRTEIVSLASGQEQRNARWANSRRKYNAGYGVKTLDDLSTVLSFFEERRGRLFGFRYRDSLDCKSCMPGSQIAATDQVIGTGDGVETHFRLVKNYGAGGNAWTRQITKPVAGSVMVAAGGVIQAEDSDFTVDTTSGWVTFQPGSEPAAGATITAGFEFDVPVRFDADEILVNLKTFLAGDIASIPLVEIFS